MATCGKDWEGGGVDHSTLHRINHCFTLDQFLNLKLIPCPTTPHDSINEMPSESSIVSIFLSTQRCVQSGIHQRRHRGVWMARERDRRGVRVCEQQMRKQLQPKHPPTYHTTDSPLHPLSLVQHMPDWQVAGHHAVTMSHAWHGMCRSPSPCHRTSFQRVRRGATHSSHPM